MPLNQNSLRTLNEILRPLSESLRSSFFIGEAHYADVLALRSDIEQLSEGETIDPTRESVEGIAPVTREQALEAIDFMLSIFDMARDPNNLLAKTYILGLCVRAFKT